jgi:hypothetical protein
MTKEEILKVFPTHAEMMDLFYKSENDLDAIFLTVKYFMEKLNVTPEMLRRNLINPT